MGENIKLFWEYKKQYTNKEDLKKFAREFYTEDFIASYSKWKENLKELNTIIVNHLKDVQFDMSFWTELTFDEFCKNINNLIENWIETNGNISPKDIVSITETLIQDYINKIIDDMYDKKYTISNLLESIKKLVIL